MSPWLIIIPAILGAIAGGVYGFLSAPQNTKKLPRVLQFGFYGVLGCAMIGIGIVAVSAQGAPAPEVDIAATVIAKLGPTATPIDVAAAVKAAMQDNSTALPPTPTPFIVNPTQAVTAGGAPTDTPTLTPTPTPTPGQTDTPNADQIRRDQTPMAGTGETKAGRDFFAIEVAEPERDDGYNELLFATNGDKCSPSPMLWTLTYDPSSSQLAGQWSDCDRVQIIGKGKFTFSVKSNPVGNPSGLPLHFRLGGSNGHFTIDSDPTQVFVSDVPVDLDPTVVKVLTVELQNGSFFLQRVSEALVAGGSYDFEIMPDGWGRLKIGRLSPPEGYCAWSALWKLEVTGGVIVDWPICTQLNLTGSGTVTVTVKPDSIGYAQANVSGLGLALWPMGSSSITGTVGLGGTYDVLLKGGTKWDRGILLDSGSDGIDLPLEGGERVFVVHLRGSRVEVPLGDITRDMTKLNHPIVKPKR